MIFWKIYDYVLTFFNFTLKTITNSISKFFSCLLISKEVSFCSQTCSLRMFSGKAESESLNCYFGNVCNLLKRQKVTLVYSLDTSSASMSVSTTGKFVQSSILQMPQVDVHSSPFLRHVKPHGRTFRFTVRAKQINQFG